MAKANSKFKTIRVERLRGIKYADVQDLSHVNVFFGKNNCGKSTLLEAIFLLTGQSNPTLPVKINNARGYSDLDNYNDVQVEFYNLETDVPIIIESKGEESRHLEISAIQSISHGVDFTTEGSTHSEMTDSYFGLKLKYADDKSSEIIFKDSYEQGKARTRIDNRYHEIWTARLINSRSPYAISDVTEKLATIIANKQKEPIISVLRVLEPKLNDVLVVGTKIMVDIGQTQYLPIQVMGDGIWRILSVIVHIYENKNGIVLVDEVDNGLHYSVMPQLWEAIFKASLSSNVQLFATTHNLDSIKGLNKVIEEKPEYSTLMSSYKLVKTKEDKIEAIRYDAEHLDFMVEQEIEMR